MKKLRLYLLLLSGLLHLCVTGTHAQGNPTIPPGVPEPGLIIWGSVVNATNTSQQIQITSASWSVTDGSNTAVYGQATRPTVQIIPLAGQSYYVLEVPFDTRRFGTIALSDPAVTGINSFELRSSSPPTYTLTATINGALATVRLIDGAPASGPNVPVPGFSAAVRGRVIRIDLSIIPVTETYAQWATRIFGSSGLPNAAAGADPDGDGFTNAGEYAAGTDPLSAASLLRIMSIAVGPNQATIGWHSVANKQYVLELATNLLGPWTNASSVVASNATAQGNASRNPADAAQFYRVRVLPP